MKPSGPLKRTAGLARTTPLKRSTAALKRSGRLRRRPKRRRPEGPLRPNEWKLEVFRRAGMRSAVSGKPLSLLRDHAHHAIRKETLRQRGLHEYVWDPRLGVAVTEKEHELHENAAKRIPRLALPASVWECCRELGEWALEHVERRHPEGG